MAVLALGILHGFLADFSQESWQHDDPGFAAPRIRGRGRSLAQYPMRRTALILMTGLAIALMVGFIGGPRSGPVIGLAAGALGIGTGLVAGFTRWTESPADTARAATPPTSWRADRTVHLPRATASSLVTGAVAGLMTGLVHGSGAGLTIGLRTGLMIGSVHGLRMGRHHAWAAYLIVTYRPAFAGPPPRRLMPFLDDMHRPGLLRAVDPVYRFRHAELQDHLAAAYEREHRKPS